MKPPVGGEPVLTLDQAAAYLGMSRRHLQDRRDVPRVDLKAPGAKTPMWRYRRVDLDAFVLRRVEQQLERSA